jgi:DNA-binding NtrC family response regulator
MTGNLIALMVHTQRNPFDLLRWRLENMSIDTISVQTCREAREVLAQVKPHLLFTECALADGSWASVMEMAQSEEVPLNVIVVGQTPDTKTYLSVMERGAFDFIVPPFEREPLNFVVRCAKREIPQGVGSDLVAV